MAKHLMLYFSQAAGTLVITEPRPWARTNQGEFPNHDFQVDDPTTQQIVAHLQNAHGFQVQAIPARDLVIVYSFAANPGIQ